MTSETRNSTVTLNVKSQQRIFTLKNKFILVVAEHFAYVTSLKAILSIPLLLHSFLLQTKLIAFPLT
jgi:hypothetical protein